MLLWRQILRGLQRLANRRPADRDIADEVESFLEQATAAHLAKGLSLEEARRAAHLEMGNVTVAREQIASYGWENAIETLFSDLRFAVRRLCASPGFSAVSILTLALGIGASTAIFSVMQGVLWKPLPYRHSEQLIVLRHTAPGIKIEDLNMAASLYFTYGEESRTFQDVSMWLSDTVSVTGVGEAEEVPALSVTDRFLPALTIAPALGRSFHATDGNPARERVVMLSDGYWRSRFGGDRAVLGRRILLDGQAHEVVGVLPPSFQFLDRHVSLLRPLRFLRANVGLISFCCQGLARLKPGQSLADANTDVAHMLQLAPQKFPMNAGFSKDTFQAARIAPRVVLLKDAWIGDIGNTLWVLMGTVGIVLLIAGANVVNLLLVRADARRQELAVRAALGASWPRLARELLLENLVLALSGGALGLGLAAAALQLLAASAFTRLPRIQEIAIDPLVLTFTLCISLLVGLLFALILVVKYGRPEVGSALRSEGRSLSLTKERHRARNTLVVVQVALTVVLLVASGLMIRSFQALRRVEPGFSGAQQVESLRISIPEQQVPDPERAIRMEEAILRNIEKIDAVSGVAIANHLPMEGGSNDPVYAETKTEGLPPIRRYKFISPGYFAVTGARLLAGRDLRWTEIYQKSPVAIVSENLARETWGDARAAIGKRIRSTTKDDWREVIGVVADLHDNGVAQKAPGIVYWPLLQQNFEASPVSAVRSIAIVVRSPRAGSEALRQQLQHAVAAVNPLLPLADIKTLETVYNRSLSRTSFTLVLLAIAGGMGLFLGVIGLYGVIAYAVSQRTREIGIRLSLGAPVQSLAGMFVWYGLRLSGIGAACGLAAALGLTRMMQSLLYEVSPADPLTYVVVSASLILVASLASYLPARKVARVDPVAALRS